ncbi:MAG: type II secretion system protein N [Pseudomonadota bacterium]
MKRWLGYLLLGLFAYAGFLVWLLPAGFVMQQVAEPLQQQLPELELNGVSGRFWQGRAAQVRYQQHELGSLQWRIAPLPLLTGRASVSLQLQLPQGYLEGRVLAALSGEPLRLEAVKGQMPVAQLQRFLAMAPVSVDGTLAVDVAEAALTADGKVQSLAGRINWLGAKMVAPQALEFGDLEAELRSTDDEGVEARLKDRGGPLSLDARVTLVPSGRYDLDGSVAAASGADASLRQALGMLGRSGADGRYPLSWSGQL